MKIKVLIILVSIFVSCKSSEEVKTTTTNEISFRGSSVPSPPVLVYKTKKDYNNRVSVLLNDEKTQIVSYPDPKDIKVGGNFLLPTSLQNGYLLDNKGIGKNVAFLKYTYEEYAKLQTLPTLQELYNNILDKNPLLELCDCGNRNKFSDIEKQLNELITSKKFKKNCEEIKLQ